MTNKSIFHMSFKSDLIKKKKLDWTSYEYD